MRIAWFHCFNGIAGDMALGALLDAGADLDHIRSSIEATGVDGHSLNVYDRTTRRWTQVWIGADGVLLRLEGGLRADGAMAMEGVLPKAGGGTQRQRIVWTPAADGRVTQRWETSDDDGAHWQVAFVGIYRHVASP